MKPFNLEEYLTDPTVKVITRNGQAVEIISTNGRKPYRVLGYIGNDAELSSWGEDGRFLNYSSIEGHIYDIFFATDTEADLVKDSRIIECIEIALTEIDNARFDAYGTTFRECYAWLEKQKGEPMPDSTSLIEAWQQEKKILEEKDYRNDSWRLAYNAFLGGFARGVKTRRVQREWSEEDEKTRRNLMSLFYDMRGNRISEEIFQKYYQWLKSLKPEQKK